MNFQHPDYIPVYFHNLRGFDSHLLMQGVGIFKGKKINCIPNNMERYVSFSLGSLRFVDSYQCLPSSLSNLVDDLAKEDPKHFKALIKEFPANEQRSLLLLKGVYPYSYMDKEEKFSMKCLPPKDVFYNDLTKSHLTDEDYEHAEKVWDAFKINDMGSYHDLYLKSDVLLLNGVFERFRDQCMDTYGLDPAHFYTCPGLAWSAALKVSGCKLELITEDNAEAYLFIESGLRGGISQISNRLATANNKHLENTYDHEKESSYLIYQDCNNLYGLALSMSLPIGDFKFLNEHERNNLNIMNVGECSDKGYILEVNLDYPNELHNLHSDYPLAPESKSVTDEMLSPYSQRLWNKLNPSKQKGHTKGRSRIKTNKLLCTLKENKRRYVCHYQNLQLYLHLGMKLKRVHQVLEFSQSPFLREYIELNTQRRKSAKGDFEKSFYKLMNNAVFGKTMENVRKRVDVQLIHTKKKVLKQVAKSSFVRCEIFTKDLVGVQCKKVVLKLNKPIAIGMSVLALSKCIMYKYHYNYIIPKYGKDIKLIMTDTDFCLYHVKTKDIYSDTEKDKHLFDFSNYDKNHFLFDKTNAKKPGLFKDETAGVPIQQFVSLRSKMYSLTYGDVEQKRAKGIVKSVVRGELKHSNYVKCIITQKNVRRQQNLIQSRKHKLQMVTVNKVALSAFDDKRYVMDNGVDTLAFGHFKIKNSIDK